MSTQNEPQKDTEIISKKDKAKVLIFVTAILVLIAPFILTKASCFPSFLYTGQIGDTIGGITAPIVGILGAILVYYALAEQIEANKLINDQFQEQKKITHRQNFEQTFFNMLNMHREIVNNFTLVPSDLIVELKFDGDAMVRYIKNKSDYEKIQQLDKEDIDSNTNLKKKVEEKEYKHRAFFKHSINRLKDLIYISDKYDGLDKDVEKKELVSIDGSYTLNSYFPYLYSTIFHKLDTHLGHYYRNLYRIVKMIDEEKFSEDEKEDYERKYFYVSIVRSQLSDHEIQWLFFNGIFDYGERFKPLIEEYSLLKILLNNPDETIIKFKPLYKQTAFEEVEWDETDEPKKVRDKKYTKEHKRKPGHERTVED